MIEMWFPINVDYPTYDCHQCGYSSMYKWNIKPIYEVSTTGKIRNKNTKHELSIRTNGQVTVSVQIPLKNGSILENRFELKLARILYNTFHNDLTKNDKVFFEDGNSKNFEFNNLIKG